MVYPAISFDFKGYKRQGVPMRELSAHSIHGIGQIIEDPEYTVLAHTGLQRITFRIQVSFFPLVFSIKIADTKFGMSSGQVTLISNGLGLLRLHQMDL